MGISDHVFVLGASTLQLIRVVTLVLYENSNHVFSSARGAELDFRILKCLKKRAKPVISYSELLVTA